MLAVALIPLVSLQPPLQAQAGMEPLWPPSPQSSASPASHELQPLSLSLSCLLLSLVFREARCEQVGVTAPPRDPCGHASTLCWPLLTHHCRASGQLQNSTASGDKAFEDWLNDDLGSYQG